MEQIIITQSISIDQLIAKVKEVVRAEIQSTNNGKSDQGKQILTLPEAAEFLSKSHATIYRLTSTRAIPFMKKGNSLFFDKKELEAWLRAGKKISVEQL
jgi:excisionase family DNA binding protein